MAGIIFLNTEESWIAWNTRHKRLKFFSQTKQPSIHTQLKFYNSTLVTRAVINQQSRARRTSTPGSSEEHLEKKNEKINREIIKITAITCFRTSQKAKRKQTLSPQKPKTPGPKLYIGDVYIDDDVDDVYQFYFWCEKEKEINKKLT